jgi:xanthine dehydrogenase accessory factor
LLLGEQLLERLPSGAHVLIMTHDHAEDFALCDTALRTPRLGSVGLIGSTAKWTRFRTRLARQGHQQATIDRITCPIGKPDLPGKEPAVIAVGVATALLELIQSRRAATSATAATVSPRSESRLIR